MVSRQTPTVITENIAQSSIANTKTTYEYKVPLRAVFEKVVMQFPAGCNNLVLISINVNGNPIFPYGGDDIRYDSSPPMIFEIGYEVSMGDIINYVVDNGDALAHTVSCLLILRILPEQSLADKNKPK